MKYPCEGWEKMVKCERLATCIITVSYSNVSYLFCLKHARQHETTFHADLTPINSKLKVMT